MSGNIEAFALYDGLTKAEMITIQAALAAKFE
jgi:hypothetical protein